MPVDEACPSVVNVVARVDGGLVRIRIPGGALTSAQARTAAAVARDFGNGAVELTNRANLQVRGIDSASGAAVAGMLEAADLSAGRTGDLRRNILATPLAGLDPSELVDVRAIVAAILAATADDPRLDSLSAKFGVIVDGGGRSHLRGRHDDVVVTAVRGPDERLAFHALSGDGSVDTVVPAGEVAATVHAAMLLSIEAPDGRLLARRRNRDPSRVSSSTPFGFESAHSDGGVGAPALIGDDRQHDDRRWVGAMPLLGRTHADDLDVLAALADEFGTGELRLTPWRGVVVPNVPAGEVAEVRRRFHAIGWLVEPTDPATRVVACAGSTGCTSGLVDAQRDARRLVEHLRCTPPSPTATFHVSGCDKRCAQRPPAAVTLLGSAPDHYDVLVADPDEPTGERVLAAGRGAEEALNAALTTAEPVR